MATEDHAGPGEGHKSPHAASLMGRLEKAARPAGDAASACTLFLGVSLFAHYLSWSQFCDLTTDLTQGSLANSLGHSIKLAAMCLIQQSQAGPESDVHLTGVRYPSRGATDCLNFKGCILLWDPPPLSWDFA